MFVLMEVFRDEEYKTRKVVPSVEALDVAWLKERKEKTKKPSNLYSVTLVFGWNIGCLDTEASKISNLGSRHSLDLFYLSSLENLKKTLVIWKELHTKWGGDYSWLIEVITELFYWRAGNVFFLMADRMMNEWRAWCVWMLWPSGLY